MKKFSSKVCEQLGNYVYLYIDPRTRRPFYVGKGSGNRCFSHVNDHAPGESATKRTLAEMRKLNIQPRIDILKYGLTEEQALLVEATAIDLLGLDELTNGVRGHGAKVGSRDRVDEIAATLDASPVTITHAVILININRNYRPGMTIHELYDATRSAWKVGSKRNATKYALSVYRGVVREVFSITGWVNGGTTMRVRDADGRARLRAGRWEFVGQVAEEKVRRKYIGKSVAKYFPRGAQNPIKYVNC